MKVTLHVPDDLYRRVKAKAAMQGRPVREVTVELYRCWLEEGAEARESPDQWLRNWTRLGREALQARPADTPSAREVLQADRDRLEEP